MRLFARHRAEMPSRAPSHRLLWASLLLALLLLLTFGAALFLFISLHNTKKIRCAALRSSMPCSRTIWSGILTSLPLWASTFLRT